MNDFRWKNLHTILMGAGYSSSAKGAIWDANARNWTIPDGNLNCLAAVNFFIGYMLKKGGNGYDPDISGSTLPKAAAGNAKLSDYFSSFKPKLLLNGGNEATLSSLATGGASYSKVDDWYFSKMPWGLTQNMSCKCKLHLSPKDIIDNKSKLSMVNFVSISRASTPIESKTIETGGGCSPTRRTTVTQPSRDPQKQSLTWEYSTMMLFKLGNDLYIYHHIPAISNRWRTFEKECQSFIDNGTAASKYQDTLWLVWSIPDSIVNTTNPEFFLDDDKKKRWQPPL